MMGCGQGSWDVCFCSKPLLDDTFLIFSQPTEFDISRKLSLLETICMKCQILFLGEKKENISKCHLLEIDA